MSDQIEFERDGKRWYLECKSESRHGLSVARATDADLRAAGYARASELETMVSVDAAHQVLDDQRAELEARLTAALARVTELEGARDRYRRRLVDEQDSHMTTLAERDALRVRCSDEADWRMKTVAQHARLTDELRAERDALNEAVAMLSANSCNSCGEYAYKCACEVSYKERILAKLDALRSTTVIDSKGPINEVCVSCAGAGTYPLGACMACDGTGRAVVVSMPAKDPRAAGEEKGRWEPSCGETVRVKAGQLTGKVIEIRNHEFGKYRIRWDDNGQIGACDLDELEPPTSPTPAAPAEHTCRTDDGVTCVVCQRDMSAGSDSPAARERRGDPRNAR